MAGIYKILNKINLKVYFGKTTESFDRRFYRHKNMLVNNNHFNDHLQRSWNKYGEDNFKFNVVLDTYKNDKYLNELEKSFISRYNSNNPDLGYNKTPGGEGLSGENNPNWKGKLEKECKVCGDEFKIKPSLDGKVFYCGEECRNKSYSEMMSGKGNHFYGKEHDDETIKEIFENRRSFKGKKNPMYNNGHKLEGNKNGMYGKERSDELKEKLREANSDLTKKQVKEIKKLLKFSDLTHREIANKFPTSKSNISNINTGESWENITIDDQNT